MGSLRLSWLLPYGVFFLKDGRAVVFNRNYVPFGPTLQGVEPGWFQAHGVEFVTHRQQEDNKLGTVETFWFYTDASTPRTHPRTLQKVARVADLVTKKSRSMPFDYLFSERKGKMK